MNIYDKLYDLKNAIQTSDEFRRYKRAAEAIDADPTHAAMAKDLLSVQTQISTAQMFGQEPSEELKQKFNLLYMTASGVSDIAEFLQAQQYFSRIMDDVMKEISSASHVDAKFLDIYSDLYGGLMGKEDSDEEN